MKDLLDSGRARVATAALALGLITSAAEAAPTVQDSFNVGASPSFLIYDPAVHDVGWYWTAKTSFTLTEIETQFLVGSGRVEDVDRTVTVDVFNDRGAVVGGGVGLATESFNSSVARGALGGANLVAPLAVTAGTTYFIGFIHVGGLGINVTGALATDANFNTATAMPPDAFGDINNDTGNFATEFGGGSPAAGTCAALDCPILAFLGNPIVSTDLPEPGTIALFGAGLVGLGVRRRFG